MYKDPKPLYKELQPALEIFEMHRQEADKKQTTLDGVVYVSVVILALMLLFIGFITIEFKLLIGLGILVALSQYLSLYNKRYIVKFRKDVLQIIFANRKIKSYINPKGKISIVHFGNSKLFKRSNYYSGAYHIKGVRDNQAFECSQLNAYHDPLLDESTAYHELIFKGIYFHAQFLQICKLNVVISSKDFSFKQPEKNIQSKKEITPKSFEELFDVQENNYRDPIELPESLKDDLVAFKIKHARPFVLKIKDNRIYIAVGNKQLLFPFSFYQEADNQELFNKIEESCELIFDMLAIVEGI